MSLLERALQLTRDMLAAAGAQEWTRLIELEAERAPLVLREHGPDPDSRARLGEILAYDRQLQALVGSARDTAAGQWQREVDRARAIAAYRQP
ncbi:flagellar protein FliT [Rhodanobacter denitrificans]|uniref:Flagellar protein FliT n=1 Tax=Rhodanobacter denitrificans TaxID=666685 RepID=A0A368KGS9_9GAMM|nr:flagellar protein FliT [Rhodanobacter denitrificans]RCS30378.1 flagellar protein FliT [Rhodanobacter denitrificans]